MTSNRSPDVIVAGGGVIGCAIAYYLAGEGARVTVVERGEIGGEASSAAAGMLAPLAEVEDDGPFQTLAVAGLRMFPELAASLKDETGIDIEYLASGILRVAMTEAEERRLRALAGCTTCLPLHWLDAEELRAFEPALSPLVRGALYSPQEHQVNADRLVQAFARAAESRGAVMRRGCRVTGLPTSSRTSSGVRISEGKIHAGHVVVAAGPWTGRLLAPLGIHLPLFPVRGQIMALGSSRSAPRHIVWGSAGYLVPKANGLVFAGATVERAGFRRRTTIAGLRGLREMASTLAPRLAANEAVDSWAGLRPGSGDGLPVIGPVPGWDGLTVASGHYRNGILLSAITGRLVARAILQGETDAALAPFAPARFTE